MHFEDWMKNVEYLPRELRDFHDQKDLFKRIQHLVAKSESHDLEGLNWVMAHIYTIDMFLWFMAAHGYTLQRSRKKFEFADLQATMEEFREQKMEQFRLFMKQQKKTPEE